jgi:hypothetical protein
MALAQCTASKGTSLPTTIFGLPANVEIYSLLLYEKKKQNQAVSAT